MVSLWYFNGIYMVFTQELKGRHEGNRNMPPLLNLYESSQNQIPE